MDYYLNKETLYMASHYLDLYLKSKNVEFLYESIKCMRFVYEKSNRHMRGTILPYLSRYESYEFSENDSLQSFVYTTKILINFCLSSLEVIHKGLISPGQKCSFM